MEKRPGAVKFKGNPLTLVGPALKAGEGTGRGLQMVDDLNPRDADVPAPGDAVGELGVAHGGDVALSRGGEE